jgi:hypothetical protein
MHSQLLRKLRRTQFLGDTVYPFLGDTVYHLVDCTGTAVPDIITRLLPVYRYLPLRGNSSIDILMQPQSVNRSLLPSLILWSLNTNSYIVHSVDHHLSNRPAFIVLSFVQLSGL